MSAIYTLAYESSSSRRGDCTEWQRDKEEAIKLTNTAAVADNHPEALLQWDTTFHQKPDTSADHPVASVQYLSISD